MEDNFNVSEYVQEQLTKSQSTGFACVEAEENILRRMITRQGVAETVVTELSPRDFSSVEYGRFFRAIQLFKGILLSAPM